MYWLFIACLLFAVNDILWKKYLKDVLSFQLAFVRAIYTTIIMGLLYFVFDGNFFVECQEPDFYIILISCSFGCIGLFSLIVYLKRGLLFNLGFYNLAGVFIIAFYTFITDRNSINNTFFLSGSLLIIVGYIFFINANKKQLVTSQKSLKDHLLLWIMTFSFSISLITQGISVTKFSFITVTFTQELTVAILAGLITLFYTKSNKEESTKLFSWKPILMAIIIAAAVITNTIGLKNTNSLITSVIGLLTPLLVVISGVIYMNEKITIKQLFAFALMLMGSFLLIWKS